MAIAPVISDLFSQFGPARRVKLLILGSPGVLPESLMNRLRSLNFEHVSPADLLSQEISRRSPLGLKAERAARGGPAVPGDTIVSLMRRWFWTRKPDAGFALTGFPATLLQAKVLDEWLDARGEALDGVFSLKGADETVVSHYRTLGLLNEADLLAA